MGDYVCNALTMSQYAKFGTRLACHVGDILIIQLVVLPLYYTTYFLGVSVDYELITFIIWGVYSTVMNAGYTKGTYGKRLMGVKVEKENGESLSLSQSAARYIIGFLLFGVVVGMLPIFFNRKKKGLHDLLIGSVVRYRARQQAERYAVGVLFALNNHKRSFEAGLKEGFSCSTMVAVIFNMV